MTHRNQSTSQLEVNPIACSGHGLCAELLPEMITLDEWGYPVITSQPVPAGRPAERPAARVQKELRGISYGPRRAATHPGVMMSTMEKPPAGAAAEADGKLSPRPDGTPIRVLVVDDEPSLAELLASVLRYEGWDIRTAADGASAVRAAREFKPDAVVLDVMLPDFSGL